jgi:hypothetical protein
LSGLPYLLSPQRFGWVQRGRVVVVDLHFEQLDFLRRASAPLNPGIDSSKSYFRTNLPKPR